MKLNSCSKDEFLCSNGVCIPVARRCNIEKNCGNQSDKQNCNIVTLAEGCNRKIPPVTRSEETEGGNRSGMSKPAVVKGAVFPIMRLNENIWEYSLIPSGMTTG